MVYNVYSIQDVLVGFNAPFIMINDELALRAYKNFLAKTENANDMRLFKIGSFNEETGDIISQVPECLQGGGMNGNN